MNANKLHFRQKGFTIIELMIATTMFSVILVVATSGVVAIGRLYYKNLTSARTQEATRTIMDQLARARQFSGDKKNFAPMTVSNYEAFCFGENRFIYATDHRQVKEGGPRVLTYSERNASSPVCEPEFTSGSEVVAGEEMLGTNMRLLKIDVSSVGDKKYRVLVKVAYGDNGLLTSYEDDGTLKPGQDPADALCKNGVAGSSFCSVSELVTIVNRRI